MTFEHDVQETLVSGLKAGRHDAFDRLYGALHGKVYNYVARMVGDREEAADITQEVFLEAYRRIPTYEGDVALEPWIYRVATNAAISHLRRRKTRGGEPLPAEERLAAPRDTHDAYEQSETAAMVGTALMGMNDRYRAALVLKDLQGLDNREVASALGVSRGTADVLLFRARHAFKRSFRTLSGEPAPAASGRVAGLAALLTPLAVPAALRVPPHLPTTATASPIDLTAPVAGGLLAKLGTGLAAKAAAVTVAAAAVTGGTLVATDTLPRSVSGERAPVSASQPTTGDHTVAGDVGTTPGGGGWSRGAAAREQQKERGDGNETTTGGATGGSADGPKAGSASTGSGAGGGGGSSGSGQQGAGTGGTGGATGTGDGAQQGTGSGGGGAGDGGRGEGTGVGIGSGAGSGGTLGPTGPVDR